MQRNMWRIIELIKFIYSFITTVLLRFVKWNLRRLTKLTELQRIVYGELKGFKRTSRVESSLNVSRNPGIITALEELEKGTHDGRFDLRGRRKALVMTSAAIITKAKEISLKSHAKFLNGLTDCLEVIFAYKCLNIKIETLKNTPYSSDEPEHELKLLELWERLMSPVKLSGRKSRQWQDIGFQGNDPATDFRGAGILSLEALLYLSKTYPDVSKSLVKNSNQKYEYPLAILCIQIVYMAAELFRSGKAKTHFFNRIGIILNLDDHAGPKDINTWRNQLLYIFYEFCCSLIVDFNSYWINSKPKDIMEFKRIKTEFDDMVNKKLSLENACFLMEIRII